MATEISVICNAGPQVSTEAAEGICREFTSALVDAYPQRSFGTADGTPGLVVTVTKANERSLGLEVVWVAPDGSRTSGMPLSTAFYDRNSDETLRRGFYATFLQNNPLPF